MAVWFISRHQGAIEWIKQQNIHIDYFVKHLNLEDIEQNDVVIGTLPIHLAAEVCQKGATFYFLTLMLSEAQRGTELSAEELNQQQCKIEPFIVKKSL